MRGRLRPFLHLPLLLLGIPARERFVMPSLRFYIFVSRERLSWDLAWEGLAGFWITEMKVPNCLLDVRDVFLRIEEQLYRLPYREATLAQGGNRGWEKVITGDRLKRVCTAQCRVNVRQLPSRGTEEQLCKYLISSGETKEEER